ncbi:hypothetical protein NKI15_06875 [Mesorhizobium sp. M0862]|uniref:hypothetical protein n=1 Tax=Mesorhizobium sp. M0862 TaxID=2957015 RepID=UPI00333A75FB
MLALINSGSIVDVVAESAGFAHGTYWTIPAYDGWEFEDFSLRTISDADPVPAGKQVVSSAAVMVAGAPKFVYVLADIVPPVPEVISDRQFFQALAVGGIITQAEALAAVKTGVIPAAMVALIAALPEANRFAAEMLLSGATEFKRAHPLTSAFGAAFGWGESQIDEFWIEAAAL